MQIRTQSGLMALIVAGLIVCGTGSFAETPSGKVSVWSGVYSKAQAERGEKTYQR